jgi:nicotinamidase-related amidase
MTYDEQTATTYRAAGFGAKVPRGKRPAVVVVDLIRGFTEDRFRLGSDLTPTIEATNRLASEARSASLPVVFTVISYTEAEATGSMVPWLDKATGLRELVEGTAAVELDPRLDRGASDLVVTKKGASAFFGTALSAALIALGADAVLVCGATTSGCVRATAVDAVQSGFRVLVPRQCVGDRASGPHDANLYDINEKYGDVIELDEAVEYVLSCRRGLEVTA